MNIIITGGHSGMGLELTKKLLSDGHHVGLIVRNEARKQETEALFSGGTLPLIFLADLSKREQIKQVATEVMSTWQSLDGLFNNAGVLLDKLYYSDYGNELQLEVNAISPYLLTQALQPLLDKSQRPFVVSTATGGLHNKSSVNLPEFKKPKKFTKLTGSYMDSKFMLVLLMNYLDKSLEKVRFVSVDPGAIKTKMTAGDGMPLWLVPIRNLFFSSPEKGAKHLYDGAFDPNLTGSGIYVSGGKVKPMQYELSGEEVSDLLVQ